ncbi:MAG: hypothetical protein JO006_07500 [Paucibacter sp.]|nr:hypothetical protein [Roseateles sp.]
MTAQLLHEEVRFAAEALRAALKGLIEDAGCNALKPQAVHRHIGVDRVLCWKVSRLIKAARVEEALLQLPGDEALSIFITAFERTSTSTSPGRIDGARAAVAGLNRAIAKHVGDRRTLLLMLDSVPGGQDGLAQSRKLLFRGASGVWGIQARERLQVLMLAPNAENPKVVDAAVAAGWVDVMRMRPDARWRLPLPDDGAPLAGDMLVSQFCQDTPQLTRETAADGATHLEIGPSATGRVGAFSIFMGMRQSGRREFGIDVLAPTEHLNCDILVHRELRLPQGAGLRFYSAAFSTGTGCTDFDRMPIEAKAQALDGEAVFQNKHYARQRELLEFMFERTGWKAQDFVGLRYELDHPPFPSVGVFSAPFEIGE